jgi:aspartate dehydrogenase
LKNLSQKSFTLLGFGAIGQAVLEGLKNRLDVVASHIVVRPERVSAVQAQVNALYPTPVVVCSQVPQDAGLVLECAGHSALKAHVLPALERGLDCAILSIGALSELGLLEDLELAAKRGPAQLHLLSGAIGGIDALAAAKLAGLKSVQYTARKPPLGWLGTVAEESLDLKNLRVAQIILQDTARQAARLYPKNANVAATISLAGLGLDLTQVCLMADPEVTQNIHEIHAQGDFGEMHITMMGKPLANNPKTSALTVLSALRFLNNQVLRVTI